MNKANLTDFSLDQINTYITMCEDSIETWENKKRLVKEKISPGELYSEMMREYSHKLESVQLLRVQLENARIQVLSQQIVNSN